MMKKISISLDEDLVEMIEILREKKRQSRSQFIKECILKTITVGDLGGK